MLPVVLVKGPTASGKTALVMELADRLPIDIISVDSAQIYRDMDIGTAKPDKTQLQAYPHALIDILSPEQSWSASEFVASAEALIEQSHRQQRIPCLVGGTMMYFHALQNGLSALPSADQVIRQQLQQELDHHGLGWLYQQLQQVDAQAAARIDRNDRQRILRALEVFHISGQPISQLQQQQKAARQYHFVKFAYFPAERAQLHKMIAQRFQAMIEQGLIEETRMLLQKYRLDETLPSMRSVGYRQVYGYLQGRLSRQEMIEKAIIATRQLAKRQITWLRKESGLTLLEPYQHDAQQLQDVLAQIDKATEYLEG